DFVVAWHGPDGNYDGVYARQFKAAAPLSREFLVNAATDYDQRLAAVAMGETGNFVIAWQQVYSSTSFGNVYAQRYTNEPPTSGKFGIMSWNEDPSVAPKTELIPLFDDREDG